MPYNLSKSSMISSKEGQGIIVMGGWNSNIKSVSHYMFELEIKESKLIWTKLDLKLGKGLLYPLAFNVPIHSTDCCKYTMGPKILT